VNFVVAQSFGLNFSAKANFLRQRPAYCNNKATKFGLRLTSLVLNNSNISFESLGPVNTFTYSFFAELGQKISDVCGNDHESS